MNNQQSFPPNSVQDSIYLGRSLDSPWHNWCRGRNDNAYGDW